MGGIGSSPEHEYEKLNYELMVGNSSKKADPGLKSLGRGLYTPAFILNEL